MVENMQAIVIEKPECVTLRQVETPVPKDGEVLLRPKVGGICGTDVHIYQGDFLGDYPVIPCHELSAEVVEAGRDVSGLNPGDTVAIDPNIRCGECRFCLKGETNICEQYNAVGVTRPGGFAEYVTVPWPNVHKVSRGEYHAAAFAEPLACVLFGLSKLQITEESNVIIWGAGAIGLLHMQVCKRLKDATVTIVDREEARVEKAMQLGADHGIVASENYHDDLRAIMPEGWDHAIEATGNVSVIAALFEHLRRGGEALVFGVYPKEGRASISPFDIFVNDWSVYGSVTYRDEFIDAVQLVSTGLLDLARLVDRKIAMNLVPEYLERLSRGEQLGKIHVHM
jgi:2-desacetyl-2-hydroxyethyl bacteriochlorophyllide A dehydrogenase